VKAYQITIPGYKPFTYITDTPPGELPAAVLERFLCEAIEIKEL
jgi:CRISPR/Cas system-associated protein Csm6